MAESPKCPKCGSDMVLREGYRGKFYGCSKYPDCKGTANYDGPQDPPKAPQGPQAQEKCPACGSPMAVKTGKNGKFYGCSKYPECKQTKNYRELCPKCGSEMTKRKGAKGEFWGCVKYPECRGTRNISGDETAGKQAVINTEDTSDYGGGGEVPF